jgi:glutathione S-transferase
MKLVIGNRAYSSWSFRGWLACKQSGEEFEELIVPYMTKSGKSAGKAMNSPPR